jgi:restriction system protein
MKMHENSLFAVLLRSPWWISLLVAAATGVASRFVLVKFDMPELYALFVALPFLVIGSVAAWKQLRAPSAERVAATLESLRALSWQEISAALEEAFRRDGYAVSRLKQPGADLELTRGARVSVVSCKRWKVARTGVEPLRELEATRDAREAHEGIYVAGGDITENARAYAAENKIRLLEGAELAELLPQPEKLTKGFR